MSPAGNILFDPDQWALIAWIGAAALAVNLPLGYLREGKRKFSAAWFVYIHLSIPLIAFLRISNHVSAWAIAPFIVCALLGQIAGGWMRRVRRNRA